MSALCCLLMRTLTAVIVLSLTPALFGQNGLIVTVAGNGTTGTSGIGGLAINAPTSGGVICVDSADNFYIAERGNNRVLRVDGVTGILTLAAGNGAPSSAGDNGPATQASLNGPIGVAVDVAGNLFISEFMGNRVRRVDKVTGIITTVAGTGTSGFGGDGGPALSGSFSLPIGLALDPSGNLYIADAGNYRIRRVDAATGILSTVAGNGTMGHSPDGIPATSASLDMPFFASLDPQGNLLISEMYASAVRRVSAATGLLSTVAGNGGTTFNGDGEPASFAALGPVNSNVVSDAAGNLYVADGTGRVRRVDPNGIITTVAGSGAGAHDSQSASAGGSGGGSTTCPSGLGDNGPATIATLDGAMGLAVTSRGNLLISDWIDCRVRSVALPSPLQYTSTGLTLNGTTLTATVTPIGNLVTPTGMVQFMEYVAYGPDMPLASATMSNGTATLDTGTLSAGSHNVMAIYMGDGTYNGSGSAAIGATGGGRAMPSMGANVPYPALVSTPVTLSIAVVGSRGQPTGTVQISEGATALMMVSLINGSNSQYAYNSSIPGDHQITLQYSGDSNYTPLTWTVTVTLQVPGSVTLTADNNPALVGGNVTFTATVSPSTATGSVAFYDGGSWLATQTMTNARAALTVSTLAAGTHSITAIYNGDRLVAPATSNAWTETINSITPTTLALTTSGSPSTWGQAVTVTATISPSAATGLVYFYDGATQVGSATLSGGSASLTAPPQLAVGSHTITAVYNASSTYGASTSPAVTQTVNKASTSIALVSSLNPALTGQSVTLTATLLPSAATGSVQFLDGATVLATVPVSGGSASFASTTLSAGSHSITAVYGGDANCNGVTSAAVGQTVNKAPSTTSLSASSGTIVYGQNVNLTASVAPAAATGTVQFLDGAAVLATLPVSNGTVPVVTATNLTAGTHTMTAVYSGDAAYVGSTSVAATVTVTQAPTIVALSSSANPAASGQAVVFTATLSPATATGNVQFVDGATVIGTAAISGGTAALSTAALAPGSHSITVVYGGDANCNAVTSAVVTETVNKAPSTTALSASSGTIALGQSVSLTASVTPAAATGTVQFLDGATVIGTSALSGGTASLTAASLAVGTHSLTTVYGGDAGDSGSTSAPVTVTVSKAGASVTRSSSLNPSGSGQAVTFTATVSPVAATGSMQFLDGATVIGTSALSGGTASLTTAALAAGSHTMTAVYSGDGNYTAATSAAMTQTVNKAPSTTSLSVSSGTITLGQSVSLTASVTPSSATGTVQFLDGATVIGTSALSGGTASLTAASLAVGTHSITAVYSGNAGDGGSTSAPVTVTVSKAGAILALASSLNPSAAGQTVTFSATLAPATATGSVQFLDGATVIGTSSLNGGTASLSTAALAAGSHSITAVYGGDANYNGATSSALAQTVKAATTTTLSADKSTATVGQKVTFTAKVSPGAATGNVQFLDGATVIGTVALSGGSAALAVSNLAQGSHSVTASYVGAAGYAASTSPVVSVTITGPPAAPSNLVAAAASSSQVNLTWTASTTSGVTYNVYASATAGFSPSGGNRIASGVTVTSYAHTGLAPSTTRYYLVTAQNANGESAVSNQASATTAPVTVSCKVNYTVTTQWNVGFGTAITIKNTGSAPINGWQLTWAWPGNQQITQSWNSNYSQTGQNATLTNESYNATIAAGATLSGMGFNGSYSGSNNSPTAFYVNGTRCQ